MATVGKIKFFVEGEPYGKPPYVYLKFCDASGSYCVSMAPNDARKLARKLEAEAVRTGISGSAQSGFISSSLLREAVRNEALEEAAQLLEEMRKFPVEPCSHDMEGDESICDGCHFAWEKKQATVAEAIRAKKTEKRTEP